MSDLNLNITNSDDKVIADAARRVARQFDPWGSIRPQIIAFILGCIIIASMDYGDVWVCVGQCNAKEATE